MSVDRDMLFKKEIFLQVSRSYGPGRYDSKYEDKNQDYPIDHVRWTAGRNFQAFLFLLSSKKIALSDLTRQKYNFEDALMVYEKLKSNNDILGTILDFSNIKNQVDENYNNINNKDINNEYVQVDKNKISYK